MKQQNLVQELELLYKLLSEVKKSWRVGNDQKGLQDFSQSIQKLKNIVNIHLSLENKPLIRFKELKQILEYLHLLLMNKDIIGITDTIEFQLIPLIQDWEVEVKKNESRKK